MLQRLRHRAQGQEGFTLIELLVVILIIGILAAVAIPTFLNQTNKAKDSNVTAYLNSAQNAEVNYQTSNSSYATGAAGVTSLQTIEKTLNSAPTLTATAAGTGSAALSTPTGATPAGPITSGFVVTDTSTDTGVVYSLYYNADTGAVTKTCDTANKGVCNANKQW